MSEDSGIQKPLLLSHESLVFLCSALYPKSCKLWNMGGRYSFCQKCPAGLLCVLEKLRMDGLKPYVPNGGRSDRVLIMALSSFPEETVLAP